MRLILNDGTILEGGSAGDAGQNLWLIVPGITMREAAEIAFDENKTEKVVHEYGNEQNVYEGFTRCTKLMDDGDKITICMARGAG